jgi:HD-like signal output (HDOD) protein
LEKSVFGFDHSEIGARLLERWRLPLDVVGAIRHHHDLPAATEHGRLAAILALADSMAYQFTTPSNENSALQADAAAILELDAVKLAAIVEKVRKGLEKDSQSMAE